jgi:hypothetical protein
MQITSYAQLGQYIESQLNALQQKAAANNAPHGSMWLDLQYVEFVEGNVPGVTDPTSGDPMPILVKGNSAASNIILALKGAPGTPFDPNSPDPNAFGPMPAIGPLLSAEQIAPISAWIDAGCPE